MCWCVDERECERVCVRQRGRGTEAERKRKERLRVQRMSLYKINKKRDKERKEIKVYLSERVTNIEKMKRM